MIEADAVVIGGGLHGCSAALNLARRGLEPIVIEKDWVGRHASGVNAGGVRTLLRDPAEIPLALAAREIWHDIEAHVGADCGYHTVCQVAVAADQEALEALEERAAMVHELGYEHEELIDRSEVRGLVPALAGHCLGGLVARRDGFASPYHTTLAFKHAGEAAGVRFHEGVRLLGIEQVGSDWRLDTSTGSYQAPLIVHCAGTWGDWLTNLLGEPVPLTTFLPMMMVTAPVPHFVDPVVIGASSSLARRQALSFKQAANGTVLIGGGYPGQGDHDTLQSRIDFRQLTLSAATVEAFFPNMRGVPIVRCWTGFEGRLPDDIPVIGPSTKAAGVFHAFGFCGHGFQLGPIVGRIIADLAIDGGTNLPIEAFSIARFQADV